MRVCIDTNILVRVVVRDDQKQADLAIKLMREAELIAIPLPCLCEFVWVLHQVYGLGRGDVAAAIEALLEAGNVAVDRPAVDVGLAVLKAGGDFADGVIAYEGAWLGGQTFISFDRKAVTLMSEQGQKASLLA